MSCCVLNCVNNENSGSPNDDVIFYRIPKEYYLKQLWTEAIGTPEWELRPNSVVCSAHFGEFDFTISETGEKLLMDGAVPSQYLKTHIDLHEAAKFKTCRVCLGMDRRMYHIRDYNLHHAYEMIVGVMVEARDRLPQMLCWECANKLMSYRTFKEKAQKTQQLLSDKLAAEVCDILTVGHIKSINRIKCNLKSHLTLKFTEPDKFDVHIDHDRVVLLPEIKIEDKIKSEDIGQEAECNIDLKLEDDDVKDELNHSSGTDSDDIKLSERRTRLVRKRKLQKREVAARKRSKKVVKEKNTDGVNGP
ncbi:uncharacterized protein LOC121736571 isoform X2 [Aricia agestis]|uniref:uncharacterized protein LOC121736571 isoform X2 n=1 Tax=Aricia agestis TaxID=91739 RepID=UPI001C207491|nr:uncharacterized protein LOC121736571 isoform X2 [Aricia agestis]